VVDLEDIVFGRNAVESLLESNRSVNQLLLSNNIKRNPKTEKIISLAKKKGVKFSFVHQNRIEQIAEDGVHQGVLAFVTPIRYVTVDEILAEADRKNEPPFILLLDSIEDPHNLGAIIRSAVAAGVHGIIIPKHNSVPVNQTVAKVSAGTVEQCKIARVNNLVNEMGKLKKAGLWFFGADHTAEKDYLETDFSGPIGIVMGSEGKGIRRLVRENCDFLVKISMPGPVESLNVSVSTALLVFKVLEKRLSK